MSKPPLKALQSIKAYCEKTQCRRCAFGDRMTSDVDYVACALQEQNPCDWDVDGEVNTDG